MEHFAGLPGYLCYSCESLIIIIITIIYASSCIAFLMQKCFWTLLPQPFHLSYFENGEKEKKMYSKMNYVDQKKTDKDEMIKILNISKY